MANYNVDIAVAIKNAQALKKFNKDVKQTSNIVDDINLKIRRASNAYEKSLNTLSSSLQKTKVNINKAAVGTDAFRKSALDLVRAEKSLNKELALKNKLLEQLRKNEDQFGLAQSSSSNRVRRNVAESRRSRISSKFKTLDTPTPSIDLRNRVRENIRQSRISRFGSGFRDFSQNPDPITSSLIPGQSLFGQSVNIEDRLKQALAKQTANKKRAEEEVAKIRETALKKIETREKKLILLRKKSLKQEIQDRRRLNRLNQTNVAGRASGFKAFSQRADEITASAAATANRPGIGSLIRSQFAPGGSFAASRGQRIKGSLSNALIGGGFPLLFGQGAIGAAGGGIGGALGGALGGGFGFGLSIAGTAIAQQIQQTLDFRKSIKDLNKEMEQMGISSNISASQVKGLGKALGITKEEAVKALQEFKRFGNDAVLIAKKFGGDFAKFDAFAQANTVQSALAAIRKINKDLTLDDELRFINSVRRKGVEATINQMLDEMLEKQKKLDTEGFGQGKGKNPGSNRKRMSVLQREKEITKEIVTDNTELSEKLTEIRDKFAEIGIASELTSFSIVQGLEDVNREIRKLNDSQFQIVELSKTLGSSFSESFKGIIQGTMNVQDAFRNMFSRIADHFIDMAAQMAAAQIQKGFLGLFSNAFSGGLFSGGGLAGANNIAFGSQNLRINTASNFPGFADGGRPPVGRASIVGERGPELFVPDRAGTIIPNNAMGGAMNVVVNVDASGSSVEGDEEQANAFGSAIATAIQSELIKQKRPGGLLA